MQTWNYFSSLLPKGTAVDWSVVYLCPSVLRVLRRLKFTITDFGEDSSFASDDNNNSILQSVAQRFHHPPSSLTVRKEVEKRKVAVLKPPMKSRLWGLSSPCVLVASTRIPNQFQTTSLPASRGHWVLLWREAYYKKLPPNAVSVLAVTGVLKNISSMNLPRLTLWRGT